MRSSPKRRRKYTADKLSLFRLLNKLQPFTEAEQTKLALPLRMAFESIKTGKGTFDDLSDIGAAINTTIVRSESIGGACYDAAIAARDALLRCLHRYRATGRVGFDGPAISDVEIALEVHEQLFALSTPLQMQQALIEVIKRAGQAEADLQKDLK